MIVVVLLFLHSFNGFFRFYGIAQSFQKIDDLHVFVGCTFQSVLNPFVRFAAYINKQVASRDFDNIVGSGLIAVQVNAVVQQHCQLIVVRFAAENFAYPVIFGKDGCNNFKRLSCGFIAVS